MAKIGTVVSAIMSSSCCWLPPLLLVFGVSGAGIITALEAYRPLFMTVTFGFLGAAFYFTYRPQWQQAKASASADCCAQPAAPAGRRFNMMTLNKAMLWGVTAMAVVFLFFPQAITGMFAPAGELNADMTHSVITVEGMTCPG